MADRKSPPLHFAMVVIGIQLVGAASLWLHMSDEPVVLGRYALDFLAFMVVYHLGIVAWIGMIVGLWKNDPAGVFGRLGDLVVRSGWFWVGLIALWVATLGFVVITIYEMGSLTIYGRLPIVASALFLTGYGLELRGFSPYQYVNRASPIATGLLVVFFATYYLTRPDKYIEMSWEDGPVEWLTAVFFLLGSLVAFYAARRSMKAGRPPWYLLGMGLLCLFVVLEEISWGQRLLGISTPEAIRAVNEQNELNLHNILVPLTGLSLRHVNAVVMILWGVVTPLLTLSDRVKGLLDRFNIYVPSLSLIPMFLLAAVLAWVDQPTGQEEEYAEFLIGLGMLLMLVIGYLRRPPPDETPFVESMG